MDVSNESNDITKVTNHVHTVEIPVANKLEIFTFLINANEFNYTNACEYLLGSICNFALSREIRAKYRDRPAVLAKKARNKFIEWKRNTGELGEFLLFCFLEGHLNAPKILSKLELKTSSEMYVHGADGLHYLRLPNGNYQLLFGESKLNLDLTTGLREAFISIKNFKEGINDKGNEKSGISFEKGLLTSNLEKEVTLAEEKDFLEKLIYPTSEEDAPVVDDAFGIFVGYEMNYDQQRKTLTNDQFRDYINTTVKAEVESKKENIEKYIDTYDLHGHSFYIYVLPFSKLDDSRKMMIKELIT